MPLYRCGNSSNNNGNNDILSQYSYEVDSGTVSIPVKSGVSYHIGGAIHHWGNAATVISDFTVSNGDNLNIVYQYTESNGRKTEIYYSNTLYTPSSDTTLSISAYSDVLEAYIFAIAEVHTR